MYYCKKCGFRVTGSRGTCPFCRGDLTGEPDGENVFPEIPYKEQKNELLIRLLALGTVIAAAISVAVNYFLQEYGWWSVYVSAGLISIWFAVGIAVRKRRNVLKAVLWQVCAGSCLIFVWDYGTGFRGWSLDFVIPILDSCSFFLMAVLVGFLHLKPQDYLLYLGWDLLLGLLPFGLLLGGVLQVAYPSVICVLISITGLAFLVLFRGTALRAELTRRFHL